MSKPTREKRDVYADVTDALIRVIEKSDGTVELPWQRAGLPMTLPMNAHSGNFYQGINILSLWAAAEICSFSTQTWATYKQWAELGAQVRGGQKSSLVIFYKEYDAEPDPENPDDSGRRRVARASHVFNADQVDGFTLPAKPEPLGPIERIARADEFFANVGAVVKHGGDKAFYSPSHDFIQMPDEGLFVDTSTMTRTEGYYSTLGHEHIHLSGAKHRLNREFGKRFGDDAYAAEELVATVGEAFLCAELEITPEVRPDHAHYLAHWLKIMKSDKKAIFTAAAKAAEAVRYLKDKQPKRPDAEPASRTSDAPEVQ